MLLRSSRAHSARPQARSGATAARSAAKNSGTASALATGCGGSASSSYSSCRMQSVYVSKGDRMRRQELRHCVCNIQPAAAGAAPTKSSHSP